MSDELIKFDSNGQWTLIKADWSQRLKEAKGNKKSAPTAKEHKESRDAYLRRKWGMKPATAESKKIPPRESKSSRPDMSPRADRQYRERHQTMWTPSGKMRESAPGRPADVKPTVDIGSRKETDRYGARTRVKRKRRKEE